MALVTTMPMSMSRPMRAGRPISRPVMNSAKKAPTDMKGRLKRMMKGFIKDPREATITMYTTITAIPIAR